MQATSDTYSRPQIYTGSRLWHYLRAYRGRYLFGLATLLVATTAAIAAPFVLRFAIDDIVGGTTGTRLIGFAGLILVLAIVEGGLRYHSRYTVASASRQIEYHMREDLAEHLMHLDQRFYVESHTGDLMARCTNDLQWVRDLIGPVVIDMARTAVILIIGVAFLLVIDVRLTLISIAYLPFITALFVFFETNVERKYMAVQEQFGVLTDRSQENISGMRAIKAHAQEDQEIASFQRENDEMMRRTMSLARYTSALFPVMILATGAATALVVWFGGHDVVAGRITIGDFVAFYTVLALLAAQLMSIGWIVAGLQQGLVSMRRIDEVLNRVPIVRDRDDPRPLDGVRGEIEFHDVSVRYGAELVLDGINLRIPAGATVALVGGTGAGKTTLANLLVRMHDPTEGSVTIDGVDVRDLSLPELRAAIGFVPQESFLFSDSLRENISYGRAEPTAEQLDAVVETSQLVNDLAQFDDGIDTTIGERGVTLSGGQKQRAALARALLKDPPILVLDDALSHVDTHTEEEILRRLRSFMAERTTILIAHRTSTLKSADFIVAIEDGRVAETGTHEELLAAGGVYARIYSEQLTEERRETRQSKLDEFGGDGAEASP